MKKKLSNKISLKKETLSNMTKSEMNDLRGGSNNTTSWNWSVGCGPAVTQGNTICHCN